MTRPSVRSDSGTVETWRLIESWDAAPEFNMGLDEALLDDPEAPPTLRLYTWSPDTLSLGYFQKWADVPGTESAGAVVRRITGGGAIHHTQELTFSIVLPQSHALFRGPVPLSYGRIHEALIAALSGFGVEASLAGQSSLLSDREKTGMCFHESTPLDVAWGERKGVGSAQRRRRGRVLHHGSIKLGSTPLEGDIATLEGYLPSDNPIGALAPALLREIETSFAVHLERSEATASERSAAQRLGGRYASRSFLRRR
jgi:lipoate-protein ligase A